MRTLLHWPALGQQTVENLTSLLHGAINQQITACIENIECQVSHGNFSYQLFADFLAAQALLQGAEGKCASSFSGICRKIAPGYDFAVEDGILRQTRQRVRQ